MDNKEAVDLVLDAMKNAIAYNLIGYHAFLLVVRFGGRFTAEDKDTIVFLKNIFGSDFVRDFCILMLTCGDSFEKEAEEDRLSFETWCTEQTGILQDLMRECNNRVILFDNKTKDSEKITGQISNLIKMVDSLRYRRHKYTDVNFAMASNARERIMVNVKRAEIEETALQEKSLIVESLEQIRTKEEPEERVHALKRLLTRADNLHDKVLEQDMGTGVLHDLLEIVTSVKSSINEELRSCQWIISEAEIMQKQKEENIRTQEEMRRQLEEENKRLEREEIQKLKQQRLQEECRQREEEEKWRREMERKNEMLRQKRLELDRLKGKK